MSRIVKKCLLMILAMAFSAESFAQDMSIEKYWSGTFGAYARHPPPGDPLPNISLAPFGEVPRPLINTQEIPAEVGTLFGILFTVRGSEEYVVKVRRILHFPSSRKGGNPVEGYERSREKVERCHPNYACFVGYWFESKEEIIIGEWRIELFIGDKKLLEETFYVGQRLASNNSFKATRKTGQLNTLALTAAPP